VKEIAPCAAQLIYSPDEEVQSDALWALACLSDGEEFEGKLAIANASVLQRLVHFLAFASPFFVSTQRVLIHLPPRSVILMLFHSP
jgi:hypothetical protein